MCSDELMFEQEIEHYEQVRCEYEERAGTKTQKHPSRAFSLLKATKHHAQPLLSVESPATNNIPLPPKATLHTSQQQYE